MTAPIFSQNSIQYNSYISNPHSKKQMDFVAPKIDNEKISSKVLAAELAAENEALGKLYSILAVWAEDLDNAKRDNDSKRMVQLQAQIEQAHSLAQQRELKIQKLKKDYEFHSSVKY